MKTWIPKHQFINGRLPFPISEVVVSWNTQFWRITTLPWILIYHVEWHLNSTPSLFSSLQTQVSCNKALRRATRYRKITFLPCTLADTRRDSRAIWPTKSSHMNVEKATQLQTHDRSCLNCDNISRTKCAKACAFGLSLYNAFFKENAVLASFW